MKVYTLMRNIVEDDNILGCNPPVSVYGTKEEARAAMEDEIKAAAAWLREQYKDQPAALECVRYEINDDWGEFGDGVLYQQWTIKAHEIAVGSAA